MLLCGVSRPTEHSHRSCDLPSDQMVHLMVMMRVQHGQPLTRQHKKPNLQIIKADSMYPYLLANVIWSSNAVMSISMLACSMKHWRHSPCFMQCIDDRHFKWSYHTIATFELKVQTDFPEMVFHWLECMSYVSKLLCILSCEAKQL